MSILNRDILAQLFQVCSLLEPQSFRRLRIVCRNWNEVTESTHLLWTNIWLKILTKQDADHWLATAPLWIHRSGCYLPLQVSLIISANPKLSLLVGTIIDTLLGQGERNVHRWTSLYLEVRHEYKYLDSPTLDYLNEVLSLPMPNMLSVEIRGLKFLPRVRILPHAPILETLSLIDTGLSTEHASSLSFPQLRHVKFFEGHPNQTGITTLVNNAVGSLVTLDISVFDWGDGVGFTGNFDSLLTLRVSGTMAPFLLEEMEAPALHTLRLWIWRLKDITNILNRSEIQFGKLQKLEIEAGDSDKPTRFREKLRVLLTRCSHLQLFASRDNTLHLYQ